ncbi:EAL domain-containing protein [Pseudomonas lalucatii]|uniref:EAL domain-containing protein n=1 Tax=Pseudomonas lalucatii TaxID=1424203 RepID=A0ABS5PYI1_9PSED|nr:EAL domain-containing protein [Pseudomonas lalucatii]MBS7661560.1 EAL domain-containing protein [Pseudomonas lalucatii]MBS7691881.1 EAL domain-containing protein [Pseudomonas lalucatii]
MSLFKQLFIAICVLMLVSFTGSFLVSVESSREQQVNQLRAHAQDAATALGLSLSPHIEDAAMVELMVSSIFDSGYFKSIRVIDSASGEVLVERSGVPVSAEAPQWFADLVDLAPASGDAIVSDGWRQAARVEVVSHPLFAIGKLWQSALGILLWLALSGLLCIALGVLLLKRQLRPLDYLVEQSNAIARREFLSLPDLPRTPEFRRVVKAMNQMVEKLKALFAEQAARSEQLRAEAYQDSLTGLANRRYFDLQLHARLNVEEQACSGFLVLLRVDDLAGLNQRLGGQRTDQLIKSVAEQLLQFCQGRYLLARNRGGEFAILAPGLHRDEAEQLAESLDAALASLQQTGVSDRLPMAHIGMTAFAPGADTADLYRRLDEALAQAASQTLQHWACSEDGVSSPAADERQSWHRLLDQALQQGRFQLHFQPVVDAAEPGRILHHKVLARLLDEQGGLIPAGRFLPWLERFGWTARLDLAMLGWVLAQMEGHDVHLALSLSGTTVREPQALAALYEMLRQHSQLGPRLTLELDEDQLPEQGALEALTQHLHGMGFGLGLQHFGGRFSMIGNLAKLGLGYLKVDGSYIRAIDQENDKRLFIEAMQRAANSIDLPLIAERVETEGEWQVLREMGISAVQGRLFGEPAPWR